MGTSTSQNSCLSPPPPPPPPRNVCFSLGIFAYSFSRLSSPPSLLPSFSFPPANIFTLFCAKVWKVEVNARAQLLSSFQLIVIYFIFLFYFIFIAERSPKRYKNNSGREWTKQTRGKKQWLFNQFAHWGWITVHRNFSPYFPLSVILVLFYSVLLSSFIILFARKNNVYFYLHLGFSYCPSQFSSLLMYLEFVCHSFLSSLLSYCLSLIALSSSPSYSFLFQRSRNNWLSSNTAFSVKYIRQNYWASRGTLKQVIFFFYIFNSSFFYIELKLFVGIYNELKVQVWKFGIWTFERTFEFLNFEFSNLKFFEI